MATTCDSEFGSSLIHSVEKNIFVQLGKYEYGLGIKKIKIIEMENRYCWLKTIDYTLACILRSQITYVYI